MNAPTDFDIGPLTWVKSEIDLALERGDTALQQFTASAADGNGGDLTQIRVLPHPFAPGAGRPDDRRSGWCHPVCRSTGVAAGGHRTAGAPRRPICCPTDTTSALAALRHYLDDLISGQPNQPLRLLPLVPGSAVGTRPGTCLPDRSVLPRPQRPARAPTYRPGAANFAAVNLQQAPPSATRTFSARPAVRGCAHPRTCQGVAEMLHAVKRIAGHPGRHRRRARSGGSPRPS
jgi:hypothetical protein